MIVDATPEDSSDVNRACDDDDNELSVSDSASNSNGYTATTSDNNVVRVTSTTPYWDVADRRQTFECICGAHETLRRCQRDASIVQCANCRLYQHARCMSYALDNPHRGRFLCPHCHVANEPIASGATLIITPQSISHQWVDEILKHIWRDELDVFVYTGVGGSRRRQRYVQPQFLANQNLVLTTYETLSKELNFVDLPHANGAANGASGGGGAGGGGGGRQLRNPKRYMAVPSPIVAVQWWRICLDEAQMVGMTAKKCAQMVNNHLCAVNRWCVTG